MQKQFIRVGSTSEHKLKAIHEVCAELGIEADIVAVSAIQSGVNEQPVKDEKGDEILQGAINRSWGAFWSGEVSLAIGIENGIMFQKADTVAFVSDFACVVLNDGVNLFLGNSAGHPVNYGDVEEARSRGFDKHTVASVTSERTGCDETDATPHYTGGRMTCVELLKQAIKIALCQWLASKEGIAP